MQPVVQANDDGAPQVDTQNANDLKVIPRKHSFDDKKSNKESSPDQKEDTKSARVDQTVDKENTKEESTNVIPLPSIPQLLQPVISKGEEERDDVADEKAGNWSGNQKPLNESGGKEAKVIESHRKEKHPDKETKDDSGKKVSEGIERIVSSPGD